MKTVTRILVFLTGAAIVGSLAAQTVTEGVTVQQQDGPQKSR